jgi:cell division protein ZapA
MPLVNVMVNSRAYTIACDEGEEDHLKALAAQSMPRRAKC